MHRFFTYDRSGLLVYSQAMKYGMANMALPSSFREGDFTHQFGRDPMYFPADTSGLEKGLAVAATLSS
jgi:hypothetical protein